MADAPEGFTKTRNTGVDFLLADLESASTLMDVAAGSGSEEKRKNQEKAHEAYRAVLRLLDTARPEEPQRAAISQKPALLKERLEKLGYRFQPKTG